MGVVIYMRETPLQKTVRQDLAFNKEQVRKLEEYWDKLGHLVKYQIIFDPVLHVHVIRTDDLGPNGLPKEKLSSIARRTLVRLS